MMHFFSRASRAHRDRHVRQEFGARLRALRRHGHARRVSAPGGFDGVDYTGCGHGVQLLEIERFHQGEHFTLFAGIWWYPNKKKKKKKKKNAQRERSGRGRRKGTFSRWRHETLGHTERLVIKRLHCDHDGDTACPTPPSLARVATRGAFFKGEKNERRFFSRATQAPTPDHYAHFAVRP